MRSSSVILCSAPESLASSPRVLGATARPTIGVGNLIGGSSTSPSDVPVCRSSLLATATMSPAAGLVDGVRLVGPAPRAAGRA